MKKKKVEILIYVFLVIMIVSGIITLIIGSNSEITIFSEYNNNKETLKYDDNTIIEFIDIGADGGLLDNYKSKLLIDYNSYYDIIKNYTDSPMLDKSNFISNDYIATYISYFPCTYESELKLDTIDINVHSVDVDYHVDTTCSECTEHIAIVILPLKKNSIFRLDSIKNNVTTSDVVCE